jgi:hypothetical protein
MEIRTSLSSTVPATAVRMPGEGSDVLSREAPTATSTASTIESLGEGPSYCDQILSFLSKVLNAIGDFLCFFCTDDSDDSTYLHPREYTQYPQMLRDIRERMEETNAGQVSRNLLAAQAVTTCPLLRQVLATSNSEITFRANTPYKIELLPDDFRQFTADDYTQFTAKPAELSLNSLVSILEKALNTQFTCGQTGEGLYEIKIDTEVFNTINLTLDFDLTLQAHAKNDVNAVD